MFALTKAEEKVFKMLKNPARIQDFLNTLPYNATPGTCRSPREVLTYRTAHCLEGAYLAAAALWYHGHDPLLLDLRSTTRDLDHVVALFKLDGHWGAISKTNHSVLRYREPIYKTVRELALSYFHEYFLDSGIKTLREYSKPFSLKKYGTRWVTSDQHLWEIGADLDDSPHMSILPSRMSTRTLRKADQIEIDAGKLTEHK